MQSLILKDGTLVQIKNNTRAKRVLITVRHGKVSLTIPKRASVKKAIHFLSTKEEWIAAKLAASPRKVILNPDVNFPLFGEEHKIIYGGLRGKSAISNSQLLIYGDHLTANKKIKKLLYKILQAEIEKIATEKSQLLGAPFKKITIRDNVSRWGSCSSKGTLSFCWRLVFAPYEIVEYLVCHELAHLKEMNHSPKFWSVVASLFTNYKQAEYWLKKNGNSLYLYD